MDNKKAELVLKKVGNLPSLPSLVNKIIEVTNNETSSVLDIANAVATDQSFSAKILRLANSAYFGYSGEISTLSQAILILGTESIKNIAFGISVFSSIEDLTDPFKDNLVKVWKFSAKTAVLSREFAKFLRYPYREEVFVAGLLHDIGRVIILKYLNGHDLEQLVKDDEDFRSIYNDHYSLEATHSELGAYLADLWNLPDKLTAVIRYHHNPYNMPVDVTGNQEKVQMLKIVSFAQYVCNMSCLDTEEGFIFTKLQKDLNIPPETIEDIIASHYGEYDLLAKNLDLH